VGICRLDSYDSGYGPWSSLLNAVIKKVYGLLGCDIV
jgi:hypothetical protein